MNALYEKIRPYIAVPGNRSIVATEAGEGDVLALIPGLAEKAGARFISAGGIVDGVRYIFDSDESFRNAQAALDAKKFPSKPRTKLTF
jgi:hypothetical protein